MDTTPDFLVENHGSIYLLTPQGERRDGATGCVGVEQPSGDDVA